MYLPYGSVIILYVDNCTVRHKKILLIFLPVLLVGFFFPDREQREVFLASIPG